MTRSWEVAGTSHMSPISGTYRLDGRGRLVLPAELRRRLGLHTGDEVMITEESDGVLRVDSRRAAARADRLRWSRQAIRRRRAACRTSPASGSRGPRRHTVSTAVDASALLILLFVEPRAETIADVIATGAAMSAVNLSEVATVLVRHHRDPDTILAPVREQLDVQPFGDADALAAAALYPTTAAKGLSLGDRACLAMAQRLAAPAVTAEHAWAQLELDVEIQVIRSHPS